MLHGRHVNNRRPLPGVADASSAPTFVRDVQFLMNSQYLALGFTVQ